MKFKAIAHYFVDETDEFYDPELGSAEFTYEFELAEPASENAIRDAALAAFLAKTGVAESFIDGIMIADETGEIVTDVTFMPFPFSTV